MFGNYSPTIKYVLFHFPYDSSDLLTKSKILAFLNISHWLGLMGFQNKWIGFLNLSKYRAQGLFRLERPALSADPKPTFEQRASLSATCYFLWKQGSSEQRSELWEVRPTSTHGCPPAWAIKAADALSSLTQERTLRDFLPDLNPSS